MAATSLSSSLPRATANLAGVPRSSSYHTQLTCCSRASLPERGGRAPPVELPGEEITRACKDQSCRRATDSDQAAPFAAQETTDTPPPPPASHVPSAERFPVTPGNGLPPQQFANANGVAPSEPPKRAPRVADARGAGQPVRRQQAWDAQGGVDVFLVFFTLITSVMFGTGFLVWKWKLGAIHFNEY